MVLGLVKRYLIFMCTYFPEDLVTSLRTMMCTLAWRNTTKRRVAGEMRRQWHGRQPNLEKLGKNSWADFEL